MITLNSNDKDIIREIQEGHKKAEYWLDKSVGSNRAKAEYFDSVCARVKKSGNNEAGDVVEYIDKNGNKWRSSFILIPREGRVLTVSQSFVYYETIGSCGAFVPSVVSEKSNKYAVMIFTPHFFQRMCERLDIPYRSSAMIQKFLAMMTHFSSQVNEDNVVVNLPGSQGRGKVRYNEEDGIVFEIRTFLTNQQLSGKQKKETEELRSRGDIKPLFDHEMHNIADKIAHKVGDRNELINTLLDQFVLRGMDRDIIMSAITNAVFITRRFYELGYIDDERKAMRSISEYFISFIYDAISMCRSEDNERSENPLIEEVEMLRIARYAAEKMGIEQFSMIVFSESESTGIDIDEYISSYEKVRKDKHKMIGKSFHKSMYE